VIHVRLYTACRVACIASWRCRPRSNACLLLAALCEKAATELHHRCYRSSHDLNQAVLFGNYRTNGANIGTADQDCPPHRRKKGTFYSSAGAKNSTWRGHTIAYDKALDERADLVLSKPIKEELDQEGGGTEPCAHLMETPTAAAAVSSSPGDTISAPCRRSRPGPAALDRLRQ
jgi:hypothetical protein